MPTLSLESESCDEVVGSALQRHLLADAAPYDADDDEIVSQLLSTGHRSTARRRRRKKVAVGPLGVLLFVVCALAGLGASVWTACSCDVIAVRWHEGGLQLSITAVGFSSYQRESPAPDLRDLFGDGGAEGDAPAMERICVGYGTDRQVPHQQADLRNFFPSNRALETLALVGPTLHFVAILLLLMFAMILAMHPEVWSGSESDVYPPTGITSTVTTAALCLLLAGAAQLWSVRRLFDADTDDSSLICNPKYSTCGLGPGGKWGVFAMVSALLCGSATCAAAYFVGTRPGRSTRCCGR